MFFLGFTLSGVSLAHDLELPVEDNVECSSWLLDEKWIFDVAVACWSSCTSFSFFLLVIGNFRLDPWENQFRRHIIYLVFWIFLCLEKICVPEQQGNKNLTIYYYYYEKNGNGLSVYGRRFSMIWHNVLPNNSHQSSSMLWRKLIWSCVMIIFLKHYEDTIVIKIERNRKYISKGFPVLVCSFSVSWHNVLLENTNHNIYGYYQHLLLLFLVFFYIRKLTETLYQAQSPSRAVKTQSAYKQWYHRLGTKNSALAASSQARLIG